MKKYMYKAFSLLLTFLFCSGCFVCGFPASAAEADADCAQNSFEFAVKAAEIIKNNSDGSMLRVMGKLKDGIADFDFSDASESVVSADGRFVLQFAEEAELVACLTKLQGDDNVLYAERDVPVYTGALEKSSDHLSWGAEVIKADAYAQSITPSPGESVTVAIVDSGAEDIDFLKDKLIDGYDFFENDSDAFEDVSDDSHGTFLASIIADCTGSLPIKIMPVRVLDSKNASLINFINGVYYAVDNGADVINISLCIAMSNCRSIEDAISYAEANNVTVVVCAGNSNSDVKKFCPSHCATAITVSSVDSERNFSHRFSNFGSEVDLAAPGENIGGYNAAGEITTSNGTSLSTAFVSAAAAMFRLDNPSCNTEQVRNALVLSAEDMGDPGRDDYYGFGIPKLSKLALSDKKYVESVSFAQNSYSLRLYEELKINPVFYPADATDKSFTVSSDSPCISVNGNVITAVSDGEAVIRVTSNDGLYTAEVAVTTKMPEIKIENNPGNKTINYGETLRLTAEVENGADNTAVLWYVDGVESGEGTTFEISPKNDSAEVTVKIVKSDGTPLLDKNGNEISDSQTVTVKSGFFMKLISFFKNLFRISRLVLQSVM